MVIYKRMVVLGAALCAVMLISGCSQVWNASIGGEKMEEIYQEDYEGFVEHEITDIDRGMDCEDGILVNISQPISNDESIEGCILEPGSITICNEGNYVISGKADECRLIVKVYDDEIVHLFLKGVELKTEKGPAIYVEQAGKVVITLIEGTENMISDGAEYASDREACIFSNNDLTINGSGKLNVYGYYHDAIRSKDRVKVIDANLYIKSQNDGIRGNDGVICENSMIQVEGKGAGIRTNSEKGFVVISGGSCKIVSGKNAIIADDYVGIYDCDYTFHSVYEAVRCNGVKHLEEKVVD